MPTRKYTRRRSSKDTSPGKDSTSPTVTEEKDVIRCLPSLSKEALQRIHQHTSALLECKSDLEPDEDNDTQLLYDCLSGAVRLGGGALPPDSVYEFKKKHKAHVKLMELNFAFMEEYARNDFKAKSRTDRQKVYTLCFSLLKSYLKEHGESVGIVSMLKNMSRIPEAIDNAFPGYSENRMLPFILY